MRGKQTSLEKCWEVSSQHIVTDRLKDQREKIERQIENGSPNSVNELLATFYVSDALRFFGAAQMMVRS